MVLTRRDLLAIGAVQLAAVALTACGNNGTGTFSASGTSAVLSNAPASSREDSSVAATAATNVTLSTGSAVGSAAATLASSGPARISSAVGSARATSSAAAVATPGASTLKNLHAELTGAGSTFDYPLFSRLFDEFHQVAPGVTVNYQSIGSGGGVQQLTQKTVDFGASDYPLNADQEKALPAPVLHVPVTLGAASVGYNLPGIPSGLKLSGDILAAIYLGDITAWNDPRIMALNPDLKLPNMPVAVVHRSDSSGTTFMVTSFLATVSSIWKSKVGASGSVNWPAGIGAKGSEGVSGQVKQTPGAIGYFELAYSTQNNISVAAIQNRDGEFVAPGPAGASAAAAGAAGDMPADLKVVIQNPAGKGVYPISGFSWVLIYEELADAKKARALVNLLAWMATTGQRYAEALTYAPLPDQVVQLDLDQIGKITLDGKPVLA